MSKRFDGRLARLERLAPDPRETDAAEHTVRIVRLLQSLKQRDGEAPPIMSDEEIVRLHDGVRAVRGMPACGTLP